MRDILLIGMKVRAIHCKLEEEMGGNQRSFGRYLQMKIIYSFQ
jgi:hypothetical protein